MIAFLKGDIVEINFDYILVDVNGVGYQVYVGRPSDFTYGRNLIYTYYQVKDDGVALYGFKTKQEQTLFLKLIDVSGIGPKTACGILGATTTNSLISAIELGNIAFLKKLPSVGPKAAQQIILDLRGKVDFDMKSLIINDNVKDAEEALIALGYNKKEVAKVMDKIDSNLKTDEIVKQGLKLLSKL